MRNSVIFLSLVFSVAQAQKFEAYENNGGLVTAIAGKNFCLLAGDTRMTDGGYQIRSRNLMRLWGVGTSEVPLPEIGQEIEKNIFPATMVGASGCQSDCSELRRTISYKIRAYDTEGCDLETSNVARLLSNTLYSRRTFPYYSFCVVAGIEKEDGAVYVYDAIGSMERVAVGTSGTGRELLQPILDRLFTSSEGNLVDCSAEEAVKRVVEAYHAVAEREIGVGDSLVLCLLQSEKSAKLASPIIENRATCCVKRILLKQH
mmetsp:Transcript_8460/g.13051  ORF Transcript_8460/g.13051 Transcript_8460/m.13051 type:complete len:260 (-) Transcript_8460:301-1080(-)